MSGKSSAVILIACGLVALCAWAPWVSQDDAGRRAVQAFNEDWASVADGCGTNCKDCGVVSSRRVPFGVRVTIEYACGLIPEDSPEYHRQTGAFISALGTVHGLPGP